LTCIVGKNVRYINKHLLNFS